MNTRSIVIVLSCAIVLLAAATAAHGGKADPTTASAQLAFGVKMAQRSLWNEALFRFQQADRMSPNNGRTINNIAVCYEALGLFDKALEYYQRAIELDGGNVELRTNYSRFVEFYRNFKPDEPAKTAGDGGEDGDDEQESEGAPSEDAGSAGEKGLEDAA